MVSSNRTALWSSPRAWLLALAVFGALERLLLWRLYAPASFGDTATYFRLAEALAAGGLNAFDGTRVPGYPFLVLWLGLDPQRLWAAQLLMGWLTSLLLFYLGWRTSGSPALGGLLGLLYDLIPGQVLFESNLLTEAPTTFLVVLSLALWAALDRAASERWRLALALPLGAAAALAGLMRPLFFFLAPWLLPFVLLAGPASWRERLARGALFSLGPLLLLGGWIGWVYTNYHFLAPTVMGGYHLVQHTGEFFEYLPDEEAAIRDTYLKYRDAQIAARGTQTNAIWDAIPELTQVSELTFYDLSRKMQRLSLRLIREHPDLYLRNVVEGWVGFWKAPVFWRPENLQVEALRAPLRLAGLAGRGLSLLANAAFLLLSLLWPLRRRLPALGFDRAFVLTAGLVWLTSVVQTLVDHGDNPRFLVPLQMVVIFVVLRAAWSLWTSRRAIKEPA